MSVFDEISLENLRQMRIELCEYGSCTVGEKIYIKCKFKVTEERKSKYYELNDFSYKCNACYFASIHP